MVVAVLALGACGSPARVASVEGSGPRTHSSPAVGAPVARGSGNAETREAADGPGTPASGLPGPSPFAFPWAREIPTKASIAPRCVPPGGRLAIEVVTQAGAAVAYQAVYADSGGGGSPPFGAGYGGNASGFADEAGRYRSAWTVSPGAPAGPGRVDVVVGHRGRWGYGGPTFEVAGTAGCGG